MQLTISREVIESIKIARDFQIEEDYRVDQYKPSDYARPLANIALNNGSRFDFTLDVKRLWAWTQTFKPSDIQRGFSLQTEETGRMALSINDSSIRFCSQSGCLSDPIEITVIDGIAQPVQNPDPAELKKIRATARIESRRKKLNNEIRDLTAKLGNKQAYREREDKKSEEATVWLEGQQLWDAVNNAWLRLEQARVARRIKAKLEAGECVKDALLALGLLARPEIQQSPIEPQGDALDDVVFVEPSAVAEYDRYWEVFLEAKRKHDTYAPKKSWSRTASKERDKRKLTTRRALSAVEHLVWRETHEWHTTLNDLDISNYSEHRKQVRKWRIVERDTAIKIEQIEQDLRIARLTLDTFEAKNPPKSEPVEVPEIESEPEPAIEEEEKEITQSFKVVMPDGSSNGQRWTTQTEAHTAARELSTRWTAMPTGWTIQPSDDPVNYKWNDAEYKGLPIKTPEPSEMRGGPFFLRTSPVPESKPLSETSKITNTQPNKEKTMSQTAPATEATVLTFTKKKETPGTFVYSEDERPGQPPIIGSLYVKRFFAAGREKVTVTIS